MGGEILEAPGLCVVGIGIEHTFALGIEGIGESGVVYCIGWGQVDGFDAAEDEQKVIMSVIMPTRNCLFFIVPEVDCLYAAACKASLGDREVFIQIIGKVN